MRPSRHLRNSWRRKSRHRRSAMAAVRAERPMIISQLERGLRIGVDHRLAAGPFPDEVRPVPSIAIASDGIYAHELEGARDAPHSARPLVADIGHAVAENDQSVDSDRHASGSFVALAAARPDAKPTAQKRSEQQTKTHDIPLIKASIRASIRRLFGRLFGAHFDTVASCTHQVSDDRSELRSAPYSGKIG